jgi:SpoVK/Ycf46/Vps4 family AAA+-type ATPase
LRPLAFTQAIPFEQIELEEIFLEHDQRNTPTWNVPNIDLADSFLEGDISTFYCRINRSSFPVGAVIPILSDKDFKERQRLDRWARIVSKETLSYGAGYFVELDVNDISLLLKNGLRKCNRFISTIAVPRLSTIQIPRKINFSSDRTKSILDCMKHFGSIVVTLRGARGSGKTYSAILLSTLGSFYYHRPVFYLDCKKLQKLNPRMNRILEEIDTLFSKALEMRNSIIVLDDLDSLSPNLLGVEETDVSERTHTVNPVAIEQSKLIGDRLSDLFKAAELRGSSHENGHFFLIATCSSTTSLNPSIFKSSQVPFIFSKVPLLSVEDRGDILMDMVHRHNPTCCLSFVLTDISRRTEGFLPCDFEKLSLRALRSYKTNSSITSLQDSLVAELADFTPLAQISNGKDQLHASWADIGGLFEVKETLESIVRHPLVYRGIYTRARMQLPRGILLPGGT